MAFACNEQTQVTHELESLRQENDSLKQIVNSLNDKYIFDKVYARIIPSEDNTNEIGSEYQGEFVFVGYNENDRVIFSPNLRGENSDTLTPAYAGYKFSRTIVPDNNYLQFKIKADREIGKSLDGITVTDNRIFKKT